MRIAQVTYSRGETINTGNFNSVRVDVSVTADIDEGESAEEAFAKIRDAANSKVAAEAAKHRK